MKKSILFLAAFAALVSCTKENPVDENPVLDTPVVENQSISFEATAPSTTSDDATKTTLVDGSLVHWVKGDAVKVMFVPKNGTRDDKQYNWPGLAYDGASGVMTATFDAETSASALFHTDSWSWGVGSRYMGVGIAVYPSSVYTYSHRNKDYYYANASTVISYNLPSNQTAVEGSFQNGIVFSYAEIGDVEEFAANQSRLYFKNACALVKVTLPSDATDVVSLKVESSDATLSGNHKVDSYKNASSAFLQNYPSYPLVMASDGGVKSVTLSAPAGETLKAGASYYIVTWPGSHSNGLSFTFTNTLGLTNTKQLAQSVELEASKIDHFNFKNSITFEHVFEVSGDSFDIAGAATNGSFTVTSSRDWTAVSDSEWLTISPASGSASVSAATVSFSASKNTSAERTAQITIKAGEDTKIITVTQAQFVAELSIERYGSWGVFPAGADFQFVTIKSNTNWTLSCDQAWLTLGQTSGTATAGETVMLNVSQNTAAERTATLYLRDEDNTVEKTFTVTQEGGKKTSGYKVVGVVLPEDMQTGKYYVIANYGDPTRYWTVGDASNYDLTLTGEFNADAYSNEFSIDQVFYVTEISKGTGMTDTNYNHRAQITLFSLKSEYGMQYITSTQTYRFNNIDGILLNLGAKWDSDTDDSVDMQDNSHNAYISTPDSDTSKITCSNSGFTGTGPRKWLIYEVQ